MDPALRNLIHQLSQAGFVRFCSAIGVKPFFLEGLGPRQLTKRFAELLAAEGSLDALSRAEAIAGDIMRLTDLKDVARQAILDAAAKSPELLEQLRECVFVEEQALALLLENYKAYCGACNLASSQARRNGKYHCRFSTRPAQVAPEMIEAAAEAIREILQKKYGGHHVTFESYRLARDDQPPIEHVAVFVESAATNAPEIHQDSGELYYTTRRPIIEVGVTFNPATGNFDVAGRNVGGFNTFELLAEAFAAEALEGAILKPVRREEWNFRKFKVFYPVIPPPPPPFATVRVREIGLRNPRAAGGKAVFTQPDQSSAYHRMEALGLTQARLSAELINHVELELTTVPDAGQEKGDNVRMTLRYPNARSFHAAGPNHRRVLENWSDTGALRDWMFSDD